MFSIGDAHAIRDNLPEMDFSAVANSEPPLVRYLQHYHLDFALPSAEKTHDVHHAMGFFMAAGFRIACQYFRPQQAQGSVLIVHGYYDHAGLFAHLISYCLRRKLAVVIFDLPGHGLSSGEVAAIGEFSQYTEVLRGCLGMMTAQGLPAPFHVLTQSTGGAIFMDYCLHHCAQSLQEIGDAVLLAPLVHPSAWQRGKWQHAVMRYFVGSIARNFTDNSHDELFLRFLRESDPLQSRRLSVAWVSALKRWLREFAACSPCVKPLSIIQGTGDTTVDWQYNLPRIQEKFPASQQFLIANARHHLANESAQYREQLETLLDEILGRVY